MRTKVLIGLILFVFSCAGVANAAGALDSTFGQGGKVVTSVVAVPSDVHVQVDGKIDVVGGLGVVRFMPNGAIDVAFGKNGGASVGFSPAAMAIQPDGKLVVAGSVVDSFGTPLDVAVARLTANGQPDRTFGNKGSVVFTFVNNVASKGLATILQPNGKIIVAGLAEFGICRRITYSGVARLNPNGSFDTTFGVGGIFAQRNLFGAGINGLALQTDAKILALGDSTTVTRLRPNGSLDSSILGGTITSFTHLGASSFQPDGKVIAAGNVFENNDYDWDLQAQRFMRGGSSDLNFSSPVIDFGVTAPPNDVVVDAGNAIVVELNGRTIVGGTSQAPDYSSRFGLARVNANGSLDATFGSGGRLTTQFFRHGAVTALAVQPDGKIVAAGWTQGAASNAPTLLVLARYLGP